MEKAERKYLVHLIDANPLGDPKTAVFDTTNYVRLGKDLEEYTENLNPDVTTTKNILGENTVTHNGYNVSSDVDPYYVYLDKSSPEALSEKLAYIANNRCTGKPCHTTKVDVLLDSSGKVIWAYREDIVVVPNSIGGDTSGIKIPFSINNNGNRVKGDFDIDTKIFTPESSESEPEVQQMNYSEY